MRVRKVYEAYEGSQFDTKEALTKHLTDSINRRLSILSARCVKCHDRKDTSERMEYILDDSDKTIKDLAGQLVFLIGDLEELKEL